MANSSEADGTVVSVSPAGVMLANALLLIMAILAICIGAYRSVHHQQRIKEVGEVPVSMSNKDAAVYPIRCSILLLGLIFLLKCIPEKYVSFGMTSFFAYLGTKNLANLTGPFISKLLNLIGANKDYSLILTQGRGENKEDVVNCEFDRKDLVSLAVCGSVGVWCVFAKSWVANNIIAIAIAIDGIEKTSFGNGSTGVIMLSGMLVYDILFVLITSVMISVVLLLHAPLKLVFPQDLLEHGLAAENFAMLGLGDVMIPGFMIAFLLRFDVSLKRHWNLYFSAGICAYCYGFLGTLYAISVSKQAQPALLYLVPVCLVCPTVIAVHNGDYRALRQYQDYADAEKSNPETEPEAEDYAEKSNPETEPEAEDYAEKSNPETEPEADNIKEET